MVERLKNAKLWRTLTESRTLRTPLFIEAAMPLGSRTRKHLTVATYALTAVAPLITYLALKPFYSDHNIAIHPILDTIILLSFTPILLVLIRKGWPKVRARGGAVIRAVSFVVLFLTALGVSGTVAVPLWGLVPMPAGTVIRFVGRSAAVFSAMAILFTSVDSIMAWWSKREVDAALVRARSDIIAWGLTYIALIVPLPLPYSLSPLVFIFVLMTGAALLDFGLALALWLNIFVVVAPRIAPVTDLSVSGYFYPANWLIGAVASLLLLFFIKTAKGSRPSPLSRLPIILLLVAGAFGVSYFSTWGIASIIPEMMASDKQIRSIPPLKAIAAEIEYGFEREGIRTDNRDLAAFLTRAAAFRGQDLHIFKEIQSDRDAQTKYELILAAKYKWPDGKICTIKDISDIAAQERQVLPLAVKYSENGVSSEDLQGSGEDLVRAVWSQASVESLYAGPKPAAPQKEGPSEAYYQIPTDQRYGSSLSLVATPSRMFKDERWWDMEEIDTLTAMQATSPQTFYAALFLVSLSLFWLNKRDELRHKLIQSEERARITQEAHDRISNRLSALAIQAESQAEQQKEAQEFFGGLPGTLRQIVTDLKDVTSKSPGAEIGTGKVLKARLEDVCEKRSSEHGFNLEKKIDIDPDLTIPEATTEALALCLEEALGNAAKHAHVRNITVTADCPKPNQCRLIVEDDGRGFSVPEDFSALAAEGHLGLAGMAKRAEVLGWGLEIKSEPGRGTRIKIILGGKK
jgi:signal transduction histidine kinase